MRTTSLLQRYDKKMICLLSNIRKKSGWCQIWSEWLLGLHLQCIGLCSFLASVGGGVGAGFVGKKYFGACFFGVISVFFCNFVVRNFFTATERLGAFSCLLWWSGGFPFLIVGSNKCSYFVALYHGG